MTKLTVSTMPPPDEVSRVKWGNRNKDGTFFVSCGGLWEEPQWIIEKDCEFSLWPNEQKLACPHAKDCESTTAWGAPLFSVPYAIIAINEGGHGSTGVCLLCVLEAAKQLGISEEENEHQESLEVSP